MEVENTFECQSEMDLQDSVDKLEGKAKNRKLWFPTFGKFLMCFNCPRGEYTTRVGEACMCAMYVILVI